MSSEDDRKFRHSFGKDSELVFQQNFEKKSILPSESETFAVFERRSVGTITKSSAKIVQKKHFTPFCISTQLQNHKFAHGSEKNKHA